MTEKTKDRNEYGKDRSGGLFYGWIVCGTCMLMVFVTMGFVTNGFSIFMPFLMKAFAFSNSQISSLVMVRCVVAFLAMIVIGYYYDFLGFRLGTCIAVLFAAVAYGIFSLSDTYWQFAIGAGFLGVSYGFGSMIPVSIIMNNWFHKHRAMAIGICGTGSGIATIIMPPILTTMIEEMGIAKAFVINGAFIIAAAAAVFLLMRGRPSDKGLEAYGIEEIRDEYRQKNDVENNRNFRSFGPTKKMWLLMGAVCVFMGAIANPGFMHLTVLFTGEGFRPMTVAAIISIVGIVMTASKVFFGHVTDRLGGFRSSTMFAGIFLAGHILCCLTFLGSVPLAMVNAVIIAIGYPLATIGPSVWAADMSSPDEYPRVLRKMQLIYAAGAMVFAGMPGVLADMTGTYISAYGVFAAMLVLTIACIVFAYNENKLNRELK